jgi:hypothetical protein
MPAMTTGRGGGGPAGRRRAAGAPCLGLVGLDLVGLGGTGDRPGSRRDGPPGPPAPGRVIVSAMPPMLAATTRLTWHLEPVGVSAVRSIDKPSGKALTISTGVRIMWFRMSSPGCRQAAVTPASTSTEQRGRRDAPRTCFTRGHSVKWPADRGRRGRGARFGQSARTRSAGDTVSVPGLNRDSLSVLRRHNGCGPPRPI